MRVFSTFSGIGGFEIGVQNAFKATWVLQGLDNEAGQTANNTGILAQPFCVGYSEIDKYAIKVYEKQIPGVPNYGDITKINAEELPDFDCLAGGGR